MASFYLLLCRSLSFSLPRSCASLFAFSCFWRMLNLAFFPVLSSIVGNNLNPWLTGSCGIWERCAKAWPHSRSNAYPARFWSSASTLTSYVLSRWSEKAFYHLICYHSATMPSQLTCSRHVFLRLSVRSSNVSDSEQSWTVAGTSLKRRKTTYHSGTTTSAPFRKQKLKVARRGLHMLCGRLPITKAWMENPTASRLLAEQGSSAFGYPLRYWPYRYRNTCSCYDISYRLRFA